MLRADPANIIRFRDEKVRDLSQFCNEFKFIGFAVRRIPKGRGGRTQRGIGERWLTTIVRLASRTQSLKAEKKKHEDEQKSSAAVSEPQERELEYLKGESKAMKVNEDQQMKGKALSPIKIDSRCSL
jgi:hypothetical protein